MVYICVYVNVVCTHLQVSFIIKTEDLEKRRRGPVVFHFLQRNFNVMYTILHHNNK